jgi:NAD(P)-dependent dehydrogenase (short-subunit alcohol dehydrogenase family)
MTRANNQPVALITGANRGIGLGIARKLGQSGFHVIISGRDEKKIKQVAEELTAGNITVTPLTMDVSNPSSIAEAFTIIKPAFNKIDVLVNNAAILLSPQYTIMQHSTEDILQTFHTNSLSALFVTQAFLPLLHKGARVINMSSSAGSICKGAGDWAPLYSASKTALNAITLHMAAALAAKNIAVNAVCPGWVQTDMGGRNAERTLEKGIETPVWLATDAPLSLTGKFLRDKKERSF